MKSIKYKESYDHWLIQIETEGAGKIFFKVFLNNTEISACIPARVLLETLKLVPMSKVLLEHACQSQDLCRVEELSLTSIAETLLKNNYINS